MEATPAASGMSPATKAKLWTFGLTFLAVVAANVAYEYGKPKVVEMINSRKKSA